MAVRALTPRVRTEERILADVATQDMRRDSADRASAVRRLGQDRDRVVVEMERSAKCEADEWLRQRRREHAGKMTANLARSELVSKLKECHVTAK